MGGTDSTENGLYDTSDSVVETGPSQLQALVRSH